MPIAHASAASAALALPPELRRSSCAAWYAVTASSGSPMRMYAFPSSVRAAARAADAAGAGFANGAVDDIHGTMIALKKADIETKLVVTVRNKLLDAWNDLWRMPI